MVRSFLFRCRDTGMTVQGFADDDALPAEGAVRYEWVRCPACGAGHLVNPDTGSLLVDAREKAQTIGL
ncbi:MAG: hypothetical protein HYZ40_19700 [Rhodospirillales bacterium]|nr:hypothetical protein [Rhodospirillales bacterium]